MIHDLPTNYSGCSSLHIFILMVSLLFISDIKGPQLCGQESQWNVFSQDCMKYFVSQSGKFGNIVVLEMSARDHSFIRSLTVVL